MTTVNDDLIRVSKARSLALSGAARSVRVAAGLSLREVATAADVSASTVWRWENRQRRPRGNAALRYLEVLDVLMESPR